MGTMNPECLYNKVYGDKVYGDNVYENKTYNEKVYDNKILEGSAYINSGARLSTKSTKEFIDFLQQKKADYDGCCGGDTIDQELLESLSDMLHAGSKIGNELYKDMQVNISDGMCNDVGDSCGITSRVVTGGIFIAVAAMFIYKIRRKPTNNRLSETTTAGETVCNTTPVKKELSNHNSTSSGQHSDEDVVDLPRIVHINRGWVW